MDQPVTKETEIDDVGAPVDQPVTKETEIDRPDIFAQTFGPFVISWLPFIYLASLIICFFIVEQEIQPSGRQRQLMDLSLRVTSYYTILVGGLAVLAQLVFFTGKTKNFLFNFFFQILLIWGYVALVNLFLTAFGYIFTYAVEQGKSKFQKPDQTLIPILFDTRLSRRPLTDSFFAASSYLGASNAGFLRVVLDTFSSGSYTGLEAGIETTKSYLLGKNCVNTWGGNQKSLAFNPVKRDFSENFMGRLAWYLEDSALAGTDGVTGTGISCALLRIVRYAQVLTGILVADDFFKMAINDSNLLKNKLRNPTQSDPFNKASRFLKRNGMICNKRDFGNYLAYLQGENSFYELSLQKSLIFKAMNSVDGAFEEYALRTGQKIGDAAFTITEFDEKLFANLGNRASLVRQEFNKLKLQESQRDFKPLSVGTVYDFADNWAAMGFNPRLIFDAVNSGQLDRSDRIPTELALNFIGNETQVGALTYPADKEVQDAIARTIREYPDTSGCEFGASPYTCCDTTFRPFDENLGAVKKSPFGPFGSYKIYPKRY